MLDVVVAVTGTISGKRCIGMADWAASTAGRPRTVATRVLVRRCRLGSKDWEHLRRLFIMVGMVLRGVAKERGGKNYYVSHPRKTRVMHVVGDSSLCTPMRTKQHTRVVGLGGRGYRP